MDKEILARRPARARARAISTWAAACALTVGCASVFGVDKQYQLALDAGAAEAAAGGSDGAATAEGIRCAVGTPCQRGSEECCFGSTGTLACASTSLTDPCPNGTDIHCVAPPDCASGLCCMTLDGQGDLLGTACAASCSKGQIELCTPGGACSEGQEQCTPVAVDPSPPFSGPWFYSCQ